MPLPLTVRRKRRRGAERDSSEESSQEDTDEKRADRPSKTSKEDNVETSQTSQSDGQHDSQKKPFVTISSRPHLNMKYAEAGVVTGRNHLRNMRSISKKMREGKCGVFEGFHLGMQWQGRGFQSSFDLPMTLMAENDERDKSQKIPLIIREISQLSVDCKTNAKRLCEILKRLLHSFTLFEPRLSQGGGGAANVEEEEMNVMEKCSLFRLHGGVDVLIDVLMSTSYFEEFTSAADETKPEALLRAKSLACEVLGKLVVMTSEGEKVAEQLAAREDLLLYLFRLLPMKKICITATDLIEVILQTRREVLNLSAIPNLQRLVNSMKDDQLANFCRICAVTVSDLDMYENKASLLQQNKQKRSKAFVPLRDINQDVLLNVSDLLQRLVSLAIRKPFIPKFPDLPTELDSWMQWIDNELQFLDSGIFSGTNLPNLPPISSQMRNRIRPGASVRGNLTTSSASSSSSSSRPPTRRTVDNPSSRPSTSNRRSRNSAASASNRSLTSVTARALASSLSDALNASTELYDFDDLDARNMDAVDEKDDDDSDVDEPFIGGLSEATVANGQLQFQPSLKIATDLMQRVEVVYVLGLFLVGKYRKRVQRKLAELRLIPGMSEVFDSFKWMCHPRESDASAAASGPAGPRSRLRGHNASCECSPEVALKIQFLRLVHSFCDHSEYKHLLLSVSEIQEVDEINRNAGILAERNVPDVDVDWMCKGEKGLLTKIVQVMMKVEEPNASTFRFWLARAVESFLRGCSSYADQTFLIRRGLLHHVASNILSFDARPKEILQSSFDLLGELVKFNINAFQIFDEILAEKDSPTAKKFFETVNRSLVDSNMFVRSLVLSLEHFVRKGDELAPNYSVTGSHLMSYIADFDKQIYFLVNLVKLINVENLTQENVSCLNTTLVFLMFADQRGELPKYLNHVKKLSMPRRNSLTHETVMESGVSLLKNFRDLLIFWQEHYLHKDKDCSALERSSRIPFDVWTKTVLTLVSPDRSLETSLVHYLPLCDVEKAPGTCVQPRVERDS